MVNIDLRYNEYGAEFYIRVLNQREQVIEEYEFENRSEFINKLIDLS